MRKSGLALVLASSAGRAPGGRNRPPSCSVTVSCTAAASRSLHALTLVSTASRLLAAPESSARGAAAVSAAAAALSSRAVPAVSDARLVSCCRWVESHSWAGPCAHYTKPLNHGTAVLPLMLTLQCRCNTVIPLPSAIRGRIT